MRETYGRRILLDEDLKTRVIEEGNFRNEEGSNGNQLFIGNGPRHLKRHKRMKRRHVAFSSVRKIDVIS